MTHPILSRIPILGKYVDERFLEHRRRSSSIGGFAALLAALALWEYHWFVDHVCNWDLLAVMLTFGVVKTFLCYWYKFRN